MDLERPNNLTSFLIFGLLWQKWNLVTLLGSSLMIFSTLIDLNSGIRFWTLMFDKLFDEPIFFSL